MGMPKAGLILYKTQGQRGIIFCVEKIGTKHKKSINSAQKKNPA
jgi:hypothetical protein